MAQEINLMHAGLMPPPEAFRSGQALSLCAAAAGVCLLVGSGLHYSTARQQQQAAAVEQQVDAVKQRLAGAKAALAASHESVELQQLRASEAEHRQIQIVLDSGFAGRTQGYAPYFLALSRQSQPNLWITKFKVGAAGDEMELTGRMTDPRSLPEYLRRLNREPLFKGQEFAQIVLKTVEPAAPATVLEFALRAKPASAQAAS